MKVIAYLRVSTESQATDGLGLEVQEHAIRTWARSHGHRIVAVFQDAGISGTNGLDQRLGLADALDALHREQASALVVYRLDRLARDLVLQETILQDVWRLECQVFSTSDAEGHALTPAPDDPSRGLIRQVLGAVAEYERKMIVLRLQAGRRRKAEKGGYAYGSPRYGQRSVDGVLVSVPHEQEAIRLARDLHSQGASLRVIADTLTSEGHHPRRSTRWHPNSVRRLLA